MPAYDPTTWVEGVTPLGPVNMNKIEAGIAAALPKDGSVPMTGKLTAPSYAVVDNRNDATTPASYAKGIQYSFKLLATIGLSGIATGTYCVVIGGRGWSDDSGGRAFEIALTDSGMYRRDGTTAGGWGPWAKLWTDTEIESLLMVPAVMPVPGEEPEQVVAPNGLPAIEFRDGPTRSVTFNWRAPASMIAWPHFTFSAENSAGGNFRTRLTYRINGGALVDLGESAWSAPSAPYEAVVNPWKTSQVAAGDIVTFVFSRLGAAGTDVNPGKLYLYTARMRRG
ncbi:MAG TPA: hypothetical protein VD902_11450 [Symbiobacteriaceae bacterium]|nr:hypothetical protein [Symbiobacteriaceae bacterium]